MNTFVLHTDPAIAAKYHVDKHVVKMPTETAQILCTSLYTQFHIKTPYKPVYIYHPCTRWAGQSFYNWDWLWRYGLELCYEYEYRYTREHAAKQVLFWLSGAVKPLSLNWPGDPTEHPKCVTEPYKRYDTVTAYRLYYLYTKNRLHAWKNRPVPPWISDTSWTNNLDMKWVVGIMNDLR
jgi:hypothetical protein